MLYEKMPFPSHHGLPWMGNPPKVDGFVEREPGIVTTQLDAGYLDGGGFTYGASGGFPHAAFQCVKESGSNHIFMSFVLRQDPEFNFDDFVMIVLQKTAGAAPSQADHRIDIYPSVDAGGALPGPPDPDGNDVIPGPPQIKTNRPAKVSTFWKRNPNAGLPNQDQWLDDGVHDDEVEIRVRTVATGASNFWSVEVRIPTSGWVTLDTDFGLYFNIAQVFPDPNDPNIDLIAQHPWPFDPDLPMSNVLADPQGTFTENWNPTFMGMGFQLAPGALNPAQGVRFKGGPSGAGVLDGANNVTGIVDMTLGHTNNFVARLQNTGTTNVAKKVRARFRLGEFGTIGGLYGNGAMWADVTSGPATNPAPNNGMDIPVSNLPSDVTDIVLPWNILQPDIDKFQPISHHQCVWVQLDSLGGAQFAQESVFRNLQLVNLSEAEHPAVVNGQYFGKPQTEGYHELLLHVVKTRIPPAKPGPTPLDLLYREHAGQFKQVPLLDDNPLLYGTVGVSNPREPTATWHTSVECYERTPLTLTFDKKRVRHLLVHAATYAYVARHVLEKGEAQDTVDIEHELAADDAELKSLGKGFYLLRIKPEERVVLTNRLRIVPKRDMPKGGEPKRDEPKRDDRKRRES